MHPSVFALPALPQPVFGFPADFVWGVATSAFQIEGAADLRGPSIWDDFCRQAGAIADGSNGRTACDHFHRWEEDLRCIDWLGVNAYRFSVSWPRLQAEGRGALQAGGLGFYDRLVDRLLELGVAPHLTLNHWDLPSALQAQGGWAARGTVSRFVDYAEQVAAALGDRVSSIATHNEPWVMATLGHEQGIFAPGIRSRRTATQVAHHLLLSHGLALQALRAQGCKAPLGIVLNLSAFEGATDSAADQAKARLEDGLLARWYLDPLFGRGYPDDVCAELAADVPQVEPGDMGVIAQGLDFLGVNYYTRSVYDATGVRAPASGGLPLTAMGWEVYPQGLRAVLTRLHHDYPVPPLYVMENGAAFDDPNPVQGQLADGQRMDYLRTHIEALAQARAQGVPVAGYMVWSLLDNFEWASGYAKRFGLVHVDYDTQVRTPKHSAHWYRQWLQVSAARAQR